ncbi:MAG: 30S ribosomal protein S20 [Bdellovibrionales bacterium]|nr:30S ribosomal protein S20 [Bdellovibrionales bacterium]
MANHKSAAKRARQTLRKNTRNHTTKKAIRTVEKKLKTAIENKSKEDSQKILLEFTSRIDRAAEKGILHKNNASRRVSRLAKKVNSI